MGQYIPKAEPMTGRPIQATRLPIWSFLAVLALILAATFYYAPGWGLMDDFQNLRIAGHIWSGGQPAADFARLVRGDLQGWGMLRPVYHLWIVGAYHYFANHPTWLYALIALLNFAMMLGWGWLGFRVFRVPPPLMRRVVFGYPLLFFLFTPFWNLFMYISIQEKFMLLFAVLSFLAAARFWRQGGGGYALGAFLAFLLSLLSKPTGIFIALLYSLFAFYASLFHPLRRRAALAWLALYTGATAAYFFFVQRTLGRYTGSYGGNLRPSALWQRLQGAPAAVKAAVLVALLCLPLYILMIRRRGGTIEPFALAIPLGVLAYIAVILPWGFPNYILSPLAPLLCLTVLPIYLALTRRFLPALIVNGGTFLALVAALAFVILPRISRMADIRLVTEEIRTLNAEPGLFFLPPPYHESAQALSAFGGARFFYLGPLPAYSGGDAEVVKQEGADVTYLGDNRLTGERIPAGERAYLLFGPDFSAVRLEGVGPGPEVYANRSWKIFVLKPEPGRTGKFRPVFERTWVDRLLARLKRK